MTLFVDINVIATYDINDMNLEVDINVSLPLGTMLALLLIHIARKYREGGAKDSTWVSTAKPTCPGGLLR